MPPSLVIHCLPPVLISIGAAGLTCSHQKIFFCVYVTFVSLKKQVPSMVVALAKRFSTNR